MAQSPIKLLDCTLRDGGYYNNWDFDRDLVTKYLEDTAAAGVDVVEIGFRSKPRSSFMGPYLYSIDRHLETLEVPEQLQVAVMINASEFIGESDVETISSVKALFSAADQSIVDIVRIAVNFDHFSGSRILAETLKDLGYSIGFNLMQSHGKSDEEYRNTAKAITGWNVVDILYFADSLGCMCPDDVANIVTHLRKGWSEALGFHAHDNKGFALANLLAAINAGVTWCDSTIAGMGRGAGNVSTEAFLSEAEHEGLHQGRVRLLDRTVSAFRELQKSLGWGWNYFYQFAGNHQIHPTYVQTLLSDPKYTNAQIWDILEGLSTSKASSFSIETLGKLTSPSANTVTVGGWDATDWLEGREVLLIGNGGSTARYAKDIKQYIEHASPAVVFLNYNEHIASELGDATVVCHDSRMIFELDKLQPSPHPIVMPFGNAPQTVIDKLIASDVLDYGMEVREGFFDIQPSKCCIPKKLALAYALALVTQAGARSIKMVGFDGYPRGDERNVEVASVLKQYQSLSRSVSLEALTPTSYPVPQGSLFAPSSLKPSFALIIPARFGSSRFEGKPLADIHGKPMIVRVWEKCCKAVHENSIFVATDDDRIEQACVEYGINILRTSTHCLTGTDRVYEVSRLIDRDIYINVQGDEPMLDPDDIRLVIDQAMRTPDQIVNGMCLITEENAFFSANTPKVVTDLSGALLYMSRAGCRRTRMKSSMEGCGKFVFTPFQRMLFRLSDKLKEKAHLNLKRTSKSFDFWRWGTRFR